MKPLNTQGLPGDSSADSVHLNQTRSSPLATVLGKSVFPTLSLQSQALEERVDSGTDAEIQFVWNLAYVDDLLLRDRDTNSNGTLDERLYSLPDLRYCVMALTDLSGSVVERFKYQAYGQSTAMTALFVDRTNSSYDWEFRYTGRREDLETGLLFFRARYYSAQLGQFVSRDPLGFVDGMSLYRGYYVPRGLDYGGTFVVDESKTGRTTDNTFEGGNADIWTDGWCCYYYVTICGHGGAGIFAAKIFVDCPILNNGNKPRRPIPPPPSRPNEFPDDPLAPVGPTDIVGPWGVATDIIDGLTGALIQFPNRRSACARWFGLVKKALAAAYRPCSDPPIPDCGLCGKIAERGEKSLFERCKLQLEGDNIVGNAWTHRGLETFANQAAKRCRAACTVETERPMPDPTKPNPTAPGGIIP